MYFRAGSPSAQLLHHDPIALDFVQIKLGRCGSFGRWHIGCFDRTEDLALVANASSDRRAWRGCLSWGGGTACPLI
jgi:hypothetical protein